MALSVSLTGAACTHYRTDVVLVSRYRDASAASRFRLPICFSTESNRGSLSERARAKDRDSICRIAAKKAGAPIADWKYDGPCLEARTKWRSEVAGDKSTCTGWAVGFARIKAECKREDRYVHGLTVTLVDSESEKPVIETETALLWESADLENSVIYSMCTAAFDSHPSPMKNRDVKVKVAD